MEKQVNSNTQEQQDKFNKTTVFLAKFIFGDNFDMMKKVGFIDSYTSDPEIMNILTLAENQRLLFLLFKNKKLTLKDMKQIVTDMATVPVQIVFSYELVNDYAMVVIDFPTDYISDFDDVVAGRYSKLSEGFKSRFPLTRDVFNTRKIRVGMEHTIYHHIFNKTQWLKDFWMKRLDLIELDDKMELWQQPDKTDLIFEVKNILKQ